MSQKAGGFGDLRNFPSRWVTKARQCSPVGAETPLNQSLSLCLGIPRRASRSPYDSPPRAARTSSRRSLRLPANSSLALCCFRDSLVSPIASPLRTVTGHFFQACEQAERYAPAIRTLPDTASSGENRLARRPAPRLTGRPQSGKEPSIVHAACFVDRRHRTGRRHGSHLHHDLADRRARLGRLPQPRPPAGRPGHAHDPGATPTVPLSQRWAGARVGNLSEGNSDAQLWQVSGKHTAPIGAVRQCSSRPTTLLPQPGVLGSTPQDARRRRSTGMAQGPWNRLKQRGTDAGRWLWQHRGDAAQLLLESIVSTAASHLVTLL